MPESIAYIHGNDAAYLVTDCLAGGEPRIHGSYWWWEVASRRCHDAEKCSDQPRQNSYLVLLYVVLVQEKVAWLRSVVSGVVKTCPKRERVVQRERGDEESVWVIEFLGGSSCKASWQIVALPYAQSRRSTYKPAQALS